MYVKFGKSTAGNSFKNSKLHAMLEECILIHSVHPPPPVPPPFSSAGGGVEPLS